MADRIIKGDSGNDVVIQNNGGTRKIEVTDSGDVEVTGDFKATTVKATNLKANDGTAGLVVADSTGEVTSSGGLKATNIKTTNLKANDGTASLEIADSTGDIGFSGNTNLKIKLPSAGGIYESDGSTQVITESGGAVSIQNATFNGQIGDSATGKVVKACEVYRISADFTASSGAMTNNWEIADDTAPEATFGQCISSVDQSTGVFTFSNTGFYLITVSWTVQNPSSVVARTGCFIGIETCTDGSTFTEVARQHFAIDTAARNACGSLFSLIDVTSTTNNKVRLMTFGNGQTITYLGNSARNQNAISFLRLGDT